MVEANRIEKDPLGSREIPRDAYYGIQTMRAVEKASAVVASVAITVAPRRPREGMPVFGSRMWW